MDKLIKIIEFFIKKTENSQYEEEVKLNFFNEYEFNYHDLSKRSFTDIYKLYYLCFSKSPLSIIHIKFDELKQYLNRIEPDDYLILNDVCDCFMSCVNSNTFNDLFVDKNLTYEEKLNKFRKLYYNKDVELLLTRIFSKNNNIDFECYNSFLYLCNTKNKILIFKSIIDLIQIRNFELESIKDDSIDEIIKNRFPNLLLTIERMKKHKNKLKNEKNKFDKKKQNKLNYLNNLLKDIKEEKVIDVNNLVNNIDEEYLIACILNYNNFFLISDYRDLLIENKKLKEININDKDIILKKYEFQNIKSNDILIDDDSLEYKLLLINKYLSEIKKYNNIVISLINNIDCNDLKELINLINEESIDYYFILDNIDLFLNKKIINNFIKNIKLLKKLNLYIKNIIKYDYEILFEENNRLLNIINKYKKYDIKYSNDIHNFEFLKKDYSYIIDKFIEIGEYNLISYNPSLINNDSLLIIKRCIFNKDINEPILNKDGKLIGNLRKEDSFSINNNELEECITENYQHIISDDILDVLNEAENINCNIDLSMLDSYKFNEYFYVLNDMFISTNKIINNMNKLLKRGLDKNYSFNELLYYSIIYNYPKLLTRENIIMLKSILEIKTKTLKFN